MTTVSNCTSQELDLHWRDQVLWVVSTSRSTWWHRASKTAQNEPINVVNPKIKAEVSLSLEVTGWGFHKFRRTDPRSEWV